MNSKLVNSFLKTADFFSVDQLAKLKAIQSRSDEFTRHARRLEPALEEKHLNNSIDTYSAAPTDENLAAMLDQMKSLHLLKVTDGKALEIVEGAHCAYNQNEVLPFLLELVLPLQKKLGDYLDSLEKAEKARSVEIWGDERGAASAIAHCQEVRRQLDSLPERYRRNCHPGNPHFTLRSAIKEMARLGFDVGLVEACGEIEPMVEDRADRAAKRLAELRQAEQAKLNAKLEEAQKKEEAERKAYMEAQEAAAKQYASKHGLTYVPNTSSPAAA